MASATIFQSYRPTVTKFISVDTNDVNLFTTFNSPAYPINVVLVINSGVKIGSTSTATAALDITSSFAANSAFLIINNGTIEGKGGAGGTGGGDANGNVGQSGLAGGPAIELRGKTVYIDNTNGNIFGGGGGGGGGNGSFIAINKAESYGAGGGGGGGGAGINPGTGGTAGTTSGVTTGGVTGTNGNNGTSAAGGTGGPGGSGSPAANNPGGNGGTPGVAGSNASAGGTGGAAGKAINLSSGTATFLAGNNGTQVKGAVS